MHRRVADELEQKVTNLNLHEEIDRDMYEEIYEKSGARMRVEESVSLIGTHEDLSKYTRAQIEEKYYGIRASYVDLCEQALQSMTLLLALDLKVSQVFAIIEEEAADAPLKSGELERLLRTAGFFSTSKFYLVPGALEKPGKGGKPKRDRGHLIVIK